MKSRTWTSILAYTSARILMFGCSVILLYVAGARGILLLGLGLVISALASYVLLNKQRVLIADKLNGRLAKTGSRVTEFRERLESGAAAEDDEEGTVQANHDEEASAQASDDEEQAVQAN
jgi:hypothetical protein